ncbi:hypothetical protein D3C74_216180 [compost metagenome]
MHNAIKQFGMLILMAGGVSGVIFGAINQSIIEILIIVVPSLIAGLFFMGFGELLEHVHKLKVHFVGEEKETIMINEDSKVKDPNVKD